MPRVSWLVTFAVLAVSSGCSGGGAASSVSAAAPVVNVTAGAAPTASPTPKATPTAVGATPTPTRTPIGASPTPVATATPTPGPLGPAGIIKHVVIIIQENRSFDNLFNGFPGADTAQSGTTSTGATVALQPLSIESTVDLDHSHLAWYRTYAGGKLYFDLVSPHGTSLAPYSYVPASQTQAYFQLGETYTVADRMFQSNTGPSFVAHQYLTAGASQIGPGQFVDENPPFLIGKWGCDLPSNATVDLLGPNGTDLPGPFPCFDYTTLADELDAKSLSWKYYSPGIGTEGGIFSAFDAIKHIRYGPDWANVVSPETNVLSDVPRSGLPDVTWVTPSFTNSDHPGSLSNTGPQWVTSVVNAIGKSPDWNSTAIFILWDDWGGWFDHVEPPQIDAMGLGFRVPLIVVSPYAKRGYVSHVQHEFGSILHFTEETFGLAALAASDARADDFSDCFDFRQSPQPFARFRTTRSPAYFLRQRPDGRGPDDD
jgi:phospholipase C